MRLLGGTLILVGLLAIGDWGLRVHEMSQMVRVMEKSEKSMSATNHAFREVLLQRQTQSTIAPSPTTAAVLAEGAMSSLDSLRKHISVGKSSMVLQATRLRDIQVAPWHDSLRQARDDYLAHVEAWYDHYSALSADFSLHDQPQPWIDSTFATAGTSLRHAVPAPDPFGFGDRVERVLAD